MHKQLTLVVLCTAILAGCGSGGERSKAQSREAAELQRQNAPDGFRGEERETIWDLFDSQEPEAGIAVNKYIWRAALETLSFLPLESADPFFGTMIYDWGRAPGSNRDYKVTVFVSDAALDARSLKVAIQTRQGSASSATVRDVEDAILTRARQLWREDPARST